MNAKGKLYLIPLFLTNNGQVLSIQNFTLNIYLAFLENNKRNCKIRMLEF